MKKDLRDIFFNEIKKVFFKKKNFYILTNDADVHSLKSLRNNKRFIDVGVAEQNMINIASGLSFKNNQALVYGFCNFVTFRCYEQLKFNVGSHKCNTKIVGIGPGFSFSNDGPTHHGIQDIYSMYLIPEFEIYNISDGELAYLLGSKIDRLNGPCYLRLDKGILNFEKKIGYSLKKGFEYIYKSKSKKILIITTGYFCFNAHEVSKKFKHVSVLNFFKLKNFNQLKLLKEIKKYDKVIIYDENTFSGGISPIISNLLAERKIMIKIYFLVCKNIQLFKYSQKREVIINKLGLSSKHLQKKIEKLS